MGTEERQVECAKCRRNAPLSTSAQSRGGHQFCAACIDGLVAKIKTQLSMGLPVAGAVAALEAGLFGVVSYERAYGERFDEQAHRWGADVFAPWATDYSGGGDR